MGICCLCNTLEMLPWLFQVLSHFQWFTCMTTTAFCMEGSLVFTLSSFIRFTVYPMTLE